MEGTVNFPPGPVLSSTKTGARLSGDSNIIPQLTTYVYLGKLLVSLYLHFLTCKIGIIMISLVGLMGNLKEIIKAYHFIRARI